MPFGGVSVIVVGDLKQLPPVKGQPVFMPLDQSDTAIFSNLWGHFKYFELTEIMRQRDEKQLIIALNNLADGKMTQDDIDLFESRVVEREEDVPVEAIRLFHSNESVDKYNDKRIVEHPGTEHIVVAGDSVGKNVPIRQKNQALKNLLKKSIYDQGSLPTELRLKIGIKYMITTNVNIKDGLVNGACGTLRYIKLKNDAPEILFLEFPKDVGGEAKAEINHTMANEKGFCNDWVPIRKVTNETSSDSSNVRVFRHQFPLVPAEAMTIHKSQGQTYDSVCVNLLSSRATRQLWYVALSRVTKLSNLYIIGKFKPPNAPKAEDPVQTELNELKTRKQLTICFNTMECLSGIAIGYHNVRSFLKYQQHIRNDFWYSKFHVLIFAETQTISTDRPELPDFKLVNRFDDFRTRGPRGILVFAKAGFALKLVKVSIEKSQPHEKSYSSTVILFECNDFYLISGYKSPNTPPVMFENQLTTLLNMTKAEKSKIFMGDFNFDPTISNNTLSRIMKKFGLKSRLKSNDFTTNYNTQIDVVYTETENIICGTYESYFSDHKPIYCIRNKEQSNKNQSQMKPVKLLNIQIKLDRIKVNQDQSKPINQSNQKEQAKGSIGEKPQEKEQADPIAEKPNESEQPSPIDEIVLSSGSKAPDNLTQARATSAANTLRRICQYIRTPNTYLQVKHSIHFSLFTFYSIRLTKIIHVHFVGHTRR